MAFVFHLGNCELNCTLSIVELFHHLKDTVYRLVLKKCCMTSKDTVKLVGII